METPAPRSSLALPIAIVVGFGLVAVAVYLSGVGGGAGGAALLPSASPPPPRDVAVRPIDQSDAVKGNPNAPIVIIEYSDYECPFCKTFHETMNLIMKEFGPSGQVAWVYRQFPIPALHPNALRISEAALCVKEIAGNDAFWKFSDRVFSERELREFTNMTRLPEYAVAAGADRATFERCLESGRTHAAVRAHIEEGLALGIQGTPQSYLLIGNRQVVIEGAQPYEAMRLMIGNLVQQLEGTAPRAPADSLPQP
jgi:protein-disulfide isomerase